MKADFKKKLDAKPTTPPAKKDDKAKDAAKPGAPGADPKGRLLPPGTIPTKPPTSKLPPAPKPSALVPPKTLLPPKDEYPDLTAGCGPGRIDPHISSDI